MREPPYTVEIDACEREDGGTIPDAFVIGLGLRIRCATKGIANTLASCLNTAYAEGRKSVVGCCLTDLEKRLVKADADQDANAMDAVVNDAGLPDPSEDQAERTARSTVEALRRNPIDPHGDMT
jgi:hypothetical protein